LRYPSARTPPADSAAKPTLDGLEARWDAGGEADGTYRFDRTRPREQVFSIDTPPLLGRGAAYQAEAPTLWDVDFQTAVAQAELEDRELPGRLHELRFQGLAERGPLTVETSRPELLDACVALVCHPDDARHRSLVGTHARTPLFGRAVPIHAHRIVDQAWAPGW
jgi:tRNA synthetases class I (I, L, M and V)